MRNRRESSPVANQTSTDDVRRVRMDLDIRFRGDVAELCAHAHRVSARYVRKLKLKPMTAALPPSATRRRSRRKADAQ